MAEAGSEKTAMESGTEKKAAESLLEKVEKLMVESLLEQKVVSFLEKKKKLELESLLEKMALKSERDKMAVESLLEKPVVESGEGKKAAESGTEKMVIVVGIEKGVHSFYALQWTLRRFFSSPNPLFKLAVVNAKPPPPYIVRTAPGATEALQLVDSILASSSARVIEEAKELCRSVKDAVFAIHEGDPGRVLCKEVQKHHATMLVVGTTHYGSIKRALRKSVSEFCARHARCAVVIVKNEGSTSTTPIQVDA